MPPRTSRDFLKAAAQRFTAAEFLLREHTLDCQYLAGYAIECALKALIVERTPEAERLERLKRITRGAEMHRPEVLLGELRSLGVVPPLAIVKRLRRFDWGVDLRYETGRRDAGETRGLLRTASEIYHWVEDQLP